MPAKTATPPPTLARELASLDRMTTVDLREKNAELFGEPTTAGNRAWLARRVGWRLQALAEGDLSERVRLRAAELARHAGLRLLPLAHPRRGMRVHGPAVHPSHATCFCPTLRLVPAGRGD
jgi:hypothetical protein